MRSKMPIGFVLLKGDPAKRDSTYDLLKDLLYKEDRRKELKLLDTVAENVFITFGWTDFSVILRSINVEAMKRAIIKIQEIIRETDSTVDTSIVAITPLEAEGRFKKKDFELHCKKIYERLDQELKKLPNRKKSKK